MLYLNSDETETVPLMSLENEDEAQQESISQPVPDDYFHNEVEAADEGEHATDVQSTSQAEPNTQQTYIVR